METPLGIVLKEKGSQIESIPPDVTVFDCAVSLEQMQVGALLVMKGNEILGIVSERDILRKVVANGKDTSQIHVDAIMTRELITVLPSTTVREAMRIVTEKRIRHLPVLEGGKLVGIISIGDLTRWAMLQQEKQISSLTHYIQGEHSI